MGLPITRRALSATVLFLAAFALSGARTASEPLHVVLLHTNDVHGQAQPRPAVWMDRENPPAIGGLPRIAAYVNSVRREIAASGAGLLVVDAGDWFQGTPEGFVDHGRAFVNAFSKIGYDAMAVGNHEFDHGVAALADMISTYSVPALVANVFEEKRGERPSWAKPYKIVTVAGVRIGMVGLISITTPSITHPDASSLYFEEPSIALMQVRKELEGRVDWILPITHIGVVEDRRLAKAQPDLDVIVGGHSHTYLKEGTEQVDTFIVQAGSKASAVGRIDLWFDPESLRLVKYGYHMIDLLDEPQDEDRNDTVDKICEALIAQSEREMNESVGELVDPLERTFLRAHSSPAGNFIADVMRGALAADVAVQNRGGIRCDLPKGAVTRRGLFELLPFGNHLMLLEISGADLFACVKASVEGTAHTGLEISGMTIVYRLQGENPFLVDLEIAGKPIDRAAKYKLATNNFLAGGGDGYEVLKQQKVVREDPTLLREVLEEHFRKVGKVELPKDERYREAKP